MILLQSSDQRWTKWWPCPCWEWCGDWLSELEEIVSIKEKLLIDDYTKTALCADQCLGDGDDFIVDKNDGDDFIVYKNDGDGDGDGGGGD